MSEQLGIYLLAALVVLVLLLILVRLRSSARARVVETQISAQERMFRAILEKAVGGQYCIHNKVFMRDILTLEEGSSLQRKAMQMLQSHQFDYIVCDARTDAIVCAVELDDHHYDKKRQFEQDLLVDELCLSAALPLLRVAPQNGYNLVEIIERFEKTVLLHDMPAEAPVYPVFSNIRVTPYFKAEDNAVSS